MGNHFDGSNNWSSINFKACIYEKEKIIKTNENGWCNNLAIFIRLL